MEQLSATLPQDLPEHWNASGRVKARVRKPWLLIAILIVPMLCAAHDNSNDSRFKNLGNRVMCGCKSQQEPGVGAIGCQQVLLQCNHHDCDTSGPMRNDLWAAVLRGDKDDAILQSLAQKYEATLVASSNESTLGAIVPFIVLAAVIFVIAFVLKRRSRPA
jgi:hypothetical protein